MLFRLITAENERRRGFRRGLIFHRCIIYFYLMTNDERNHFGAQILDASIAVHRELGPGLLESAYELALMQELRKKGLGVRRQVPVPLSYKGINLGKGYEIDLLVEDEIIVEIKAVLDMHPIYTAQIIT